MTLYLLEWDNGLEYADHECTLLGIYSTEDHRRAAREYYVANCSKKWPFNHDGAFLEWEVEMNKEFYP